MPIYRGLHPARVYRGDSMPRAVYRGDVEIWRRDAVFQRVAGGAVAVPPWAAYVDVIALGGGGGGANGRVVAGTGGDAGKWGADTYPTPPGAQLAVTIGAGGNGGVASAFGNTPGGSGTATNVTVTNNGTVTGMVSGAGGAGGEGSPGRLGQSPGVCPYFDSPTDSTGATIAGGGTASADQAGKPPGGGGGAGRGAFAPVNGQPGAAGAAWIRFRSY